MYDNAIELHLAAAERQEEHARHLRARGMDAMAAVADERAERARARAESHAIRLVLLERERERRSHGAGFVNTGQG